MALFQISARLTHQEKGSWEWGHAGSLAGSVHLAELSCQSIGSFNLTHVVSYLNNPPPVSAFNGNVKCSLLKTMQLIHGGIPLLIFSDMKQYNRGPLLLTDTSHRVICKFLCFSKV
jgi:hypothetical protein